MVLTCPFCGELPNRFVTIEISNGRYDNTHYIMNCQISCPKKCVTFVKDVELYEIARTPFDKVQTAFSELDQRWNRRAYT